MNKRFIGKKPYQPIPGLKFLFLIELPLFAGKKPKFALNK
jgi:hypothetical protein